MKKHRLQIFRGYFSEILLVVIIYALLRIFFTYGDLAIYLKKSSSEWKVITGALFASSIALWGFFKKLEADFLDWLHWRGADKIFNAAYLTAIFIFLTTFFALILSSTLDCMAVSHIALICLLYSCLNSITMIRNTSSLFHLKSEFMMYFKNEKSK